MSLSFVFNYQWSSESKFKLRPAVGLATLCFIQTILQKYIHKLFFYYFAIIHTLNLKVSEDTLGTGESVYHALSTHICWFRRLSHTSPCGQLLGVVTTAIPGPSLYLWVTISRKTDGCWWKLKGYRGQRFTKKRKILAGKISHFCVNISMNEAQETYLPLLLLLCWLLWTLCTSSFSPLS